ncbi:hypothetical protein ASF28_04075 [Methylobacterium sp. Leaf99]|uniref:hypothetical protein n=1 Tax=Methylobacterium sp. Leaf99 TaxID=1736251 RepID=UPI0006FE7D50|nr:hypothetical protein [Methylobacterium sp. Leaf99]KQP10328.1 hypothetical protein ASF28_04075 [Methylobacterium sp. Leaf99]
MNRGTGGDREGGDKDRKPGGIVPANDNDGANGEPIRGKRGIIEEQAEIVRRIFRDQVAGKGPQRIAADLTGSRARARPCGP